MELLIIENKGSEFYLEDFPLKTLVGKGEDCVITLTVALISKLSILILLF